MTRTIILAAIGALLAMGALQAQTNNPELERLFQEDQADREAGPNANIDWQAVSKRDAADEERAKWNVPPLAEQRKKLETLNAPRQ